jgi:DNA-binding NtrC family response regulator
MSWPVSPTDRLPDVERIVTVLAVHPSDDDQHALLEIFGHSKWCVHFAKSRQEALEALRNRSHAIVICEAILPDGSWKDVLTATIPLPAAPPIIVTSQHADNRLWAEVLNLGGYDVLAKPFDLKEVVRITSLAWLHWKERIVPSKPCVSSQKAYQARAAS